MPYEVIPDNCPAHRMEVAYAERLAKIETMLEGLIKQISHNRIDRWVYLVGGNIFGGMVGFIFTYYLTK